MKEIKSKHFVVLLAGAFVLALGLLFCCNFIAQKLWGVTEKEPIGQGSFDFGPANTLRKRKVEYFLNEKLPYNAFIFGGSKAGALSCNKLNELSGNNFYNFWFAIGNFYDYKLYTDFILENCENNINEIIIHLSSHEAYGFQRVKYVPYKITKNPLKKLQYILENFQETYLSWNFVIDKILENFKKGDLSFDNFFNFTKKTEQNKKNKVNTLNFTKLTGENREEYFASIKAKHEKDYESFYKAVFFSGENEYSETMYKLFNETPELPACEQNIEQLKKIKEKVGKKGIKFTVVIGPTFIAECYAYASPKYAQYLKDLVSVCGNVWNFSGINDVNKNPYNFYNSGHYYRFVGDVMIETMYGKPNTDNLDAFGILLNQNNIDAFLSRQSEKWHILKEEYEKTGTVALHPKEHESYLGN